MQARLSYQTLSAFIVVLACLAVFALSSRPARVQSPPQTREANGGAGLVTIHAAAKGNLHLRDGYELRTDSGKGASAKPGAAEPVALASGDFDEDGVPDLATAYRGGRLSIYRGNVDAIYPNSQEAQGRKRSGQFTSEAFLPNEEILAVPDIPDVILAGDFTADGHQDIVVASYNSPSIRLLPGNGDGQFLTVKDIKVKGSVTAIASGQIGRADNLADLAVGVVTPTGPQLFIYEHPEGAFKHPPETFNLPAPATAIVLGQFDEDSLFDVAIACGNKLVIVHGHMQIYPWDLSPSLHLQRPPAQIGERELGYEIAGLTAGHFSNSRRQALALFSTDGSIHLLEAPAPRPNHHETGSVLDAASLKPVVVPADGQFPAYKILTAAAPQFSSPEEAKKAGYVVTDGKQDPRQALEDMFKAAHQRPVSKEATGAKQKTDAPKLPPSFFTAPSRIREWRDSLLTSDAGLAFAAQAGTRNLLTKARVSNSQTDDLVVLEKFANKIQIISTQLPDDDHSQTRLSPQAATAARITTLTSLDVEGAPEAILPMRLNADALTDLVVVRSGSESPSVVITTPASTFTVNSAADNVVSNCTDTSATCTLRDAIDRANNNPGSTIAFNIPGGGVQTISPFTELPVVRQPVTIDGTTQPGYNGSPVIEIKGNNFPSNHGVDGLKIRASNCVVRGLAINEFPHAFVGGVFIGGNGLTLESLSSQNNGNNLVEGNFLGTNPGGTTAHGNAGANLNIFDSDNNTIGGTSAQARNVMSGDGVLDTGFGIQLLGNNNLVEGNYIGTDATGNQKLSNSRGLLLLGSNNLIGGDAVGAGNVISGNGVLVPNTSQCAGGGITEGLLFSENDPDTNLTLNNLIKGNKIGTNATGTARLGNCYAGISALTPSQLIIGSITSGGRNIISNNGYTAIDIEKGGPDGGFTAISGDNIGTDITGTVAMPNNLGNQPGGFNVPYAVITVRPNPGSFVNVGSPGGTSPGGSCTGFCTLVSGNFDNNNGTLAAVYRNGEGEFGIFSSFVGTDISGTLPLPNYDGVIANGETTYVGFPGITSGNLISGNRTLAVVLEPAFGFTGYMAGNLIGTDTTGNNPLPNNSDPLPFAAVVHADASFSSGTVVIGGPNSLDRNIISGNILGALEVSGNVIVQNNYIGVNRNAAPLPNTGDGITSDGSFVQIGGTGAGESNIISNNGKTGILVKSGAADIRGNTITNNVKAGVSVTGSSTNATIRQNVIANNGDLGIDLGGDGVTQNDCDDSDEGPNGLQNYPLLSTPTDQGGGMVKSHGTIKSTPHVTFTIELYTNAAADPSNYGEGETFAGSVVVTTGPYGIAEFDSPNVAAGQVITATATNQDGQTSEFSCGAGLCQQDAINRFRESPEAIGCADPIIVNTTGDQDDGDANDGVCDVDPNQTGNQCTLRAAIEEANLRGGGAFVAFDIPGGGVQTISPTTPLPPITAKVRIDATTQPGYNDTPLIELSGAGVGNNVTGIRVTGGPATIRGFAINRFALGNGIVLDGNLNSGQGGSSVKACVIGTTPDGTALSGNMTNGIVIDNSQSNTIGVATNETASFARNIIAGSTYSNVLVQGAQAQQNTVAGNYFDVAVDGTNPFLNPLARGVTLTLGALNNTVGGNTPDQENRFSSEFYGVLISEAANLNKVFRNDLNHCDVGIGILRASNNIIGGDITEVANVIVQSNGAIFLSDVDPPTPTSPTQGNLKRFAPSESRFRDNSSPLLEPAELFNSIQSKRGPISPLAGLASSTQGNTVQGNLIGTDATGSNLNNQSGITLYKATGNLIGGSTTSLRNVISFNQGIGVQLSTGANNNTLDHNWIGLDGQTGQQPQGNLGSGVVIDGGSNNTLKFNRISANLHGVRIMESLNDPNTPLPTGNTLTFNFIGTDITGTIAVGNIHHGVLIDAGTSTKIDRNLISGNSIATIIPDAGIAIAPGVTGTTVTSNSIGTNLTGTAALGNKGIGIGIEGSGNVAINNVISGNLVGILVGRGAAASPFPAPANNIIQSNLVGLDKNGTAAIPNTTQGIVIANGANSNVIGGLIDSNGNPAVLTSNGTNPLGNVVSGNLLAGIVIQPGNDPGAVSPFANKIQGNLIGTNRTGTGAVPNVHSGMLVYNSQDNLIGGFGTDIPLGRNIISGNGKSGIQISGPSSGQNRVAGNFIGTKIDGTSALGNNLGGVYLFDAAHNNIIGGTNQNAGNTIAFNVGYGVYIRSDAGAGNLVDPNSMFSNTQLGIGLDGSGMSYDDTPDEADTEGNGIPLPNDPGDGDSGPNNLQNFPKFFSAIINGGGDLVLQYKIDSAPENTNYGDEGLYVEIFKADEGLQGKTFIGSTNYTLANYNNGTPGMATLILPDAAGLDIHIGDKLVATATDADGNTSEFTSTNVGIVSAPTAATALISGKITLTDGATLGGVVVSLDGSQTRRGITDSNGNYRFENVETGGFYSVTPSRANYSFNPANRSFSILGSKTDATFVAVADQTDNLNPLDTPEFFVRQQYLDFLNREPDAGGFDYWTIAITGCGADSQCLRTQRVDVSNAFFYEREFQESGAFVYRIYKAAVGQRPTFAQFQPDRALVVGGATLDQSKSAFVLAFVQRDLFRQRYPIDQTADEFVGALLSSISEHSGVDLASQRAALTVLYDGTDHGRAVILRQLADNQTLVDAEYNSSFVLSQYFGYLRRDPDIDGFKFWLDQVNSAPLRALAKQHAMVCSFITSTEYQRRFSSVVTHSNAECQ